MSSNPGSSRPSQRWINLTLAAVAGQVGCLTLVIILAALFGGLWLDRHFQTRPILTIVLMVVSMPVSLLAMLFVVRSATARIRTQQSQNPDTRTKEDDFGKNS